MLLCDVNSLDWSKFNILRWNILVHLPEKVVLLTGVELSPAVRILKPSSSLIDAYQMEKWNFTFVLIAVPEGRPIVITGINHFDTTSLYREHMNVIWSMNKKSEEKKKRSSTVAVVTLPDCSGLKLRCDFVVFPSGLWAVSTLPIRGVSRLCCWKCPNVSRRSPPLVLWAFVKRLGCRFPLSVSGVVPFDLCCAQLLSPLNVPLIP